MLDWIVELLGRCPLIKQITVIGPDSLDELLGMRSVSRRIGPSDAALESIEGLIQNENSAGSGGYVIIPVGAILLSAEHLARMIEEFDTTDAAIGIPVIELNEVDRTGIRHHEEMMLDGRIRVPGIIAFTHEARYLPVAMRKLELYHQKKNPLAKSGVLAATAAVEEVVTQEGTKFIETHDPGAAISIDTEQERLIAEQFLPPPPAPKFTKATVIINPNSGLGPQLPGFVRKILGVRRKKTPEALGKPDYSREIQDSLHELGIEAVLMPTRNSHEASEKARECVRNGCELVVAAGGDGTINAVVNQLAGSTTAFGAIPLGTMNVFALQMGLPMEIRAACQILAAGNVRTIDLGKAGTQYFACLSGIGFDAYVIARTNTTLKSLLGAFSYSVAAAWNFLTYRFRKIQLSIDNGPVETGYMVVIGNGKYYSSNVFITRDARFDDGLLDVVLFKSRRLRHMLRYVRQMSEGSLADLENVVHFRGKHISIKQHGNHYVHFDGEHIGYTPIDISVVPSALRVVC